MEGVARDPVDAEAREDACLLRELVRRASVHDARSDSPM
jgi:hypothetical protein